MSSNPSREWGMHWLGCPVCTLGDRPEDDVVCELGQQLRDIALEEIRQRTRSFTYGERP